MTRLISLVIAFVPLIFVFFVPEILKLSFFTRALRLSIADRRGDRLLSAAVPQQPRRHARPARVGGLHHASGTCSATRTASTTCMSPP